MLAWWNWEHERRKFDDELQEALKRQRFNWEIVARFFKTACVVPRLRDHKAL